MSKEPKILYWDIPPYYKIEVNGPNVTVLSYSRKKKGVSLSQYKNAYGYLQVKIFNKSTSIHRIVANQFLGLKPEKLVTNHIDGNKLNNHPSNLEYCTIKENIQHAVKLGLHVSGHPERNGRYIHGRCNADIKKYKKEWREVNRERISLQNKVRYQNQKKVKNA
jgi:hypothetical protein